MGIEQAVVDLATDSFNPQRNLTCGLEYEALNQSASAIGFYLRAAEYGHDKDLLVTYTALLKLSNLMYAQHERTTSVLKSLLQAVAYWPERPEAYFLLTKYYERTQNWQECYTWAQVGLSKPDGHPLPADVGYGGKYCLEFQKAVAAWWIGRPHESREIFPRLLDTAKMSEEYVNGCINNITNLGL